MTSAPEAILVVDDEKDFAQGLARLLKASFPDQNIIVRHSGPEALAVLGRESISVMLSDLRMPSMSGQTLLEGALGLEPSLTVVMLTAYGTVETAVQALKAGAYDFLTKPVGGDVLTRVMSRCLDRSRLIRENQRLRDLAVRPGLQAALVGESLAMRRLKETIAAVAASDYTVLIRGESGTGKELVASTIHSLSRRASGRLVTVNCPAIPETLLESELFGHVKGAFTGAEKARKGLFLNADKGTILLDEIGDIASPIQTKLLRVLQEGEIRPVGSSEQVRVDVRVLASTNQDLEARITDRTFREDLFYRLNVLAIHVPPLRERTEDVPLLSAHFLQQACREMGVPRKELTPEALAYMAAHPWPGNVRELLNFIRRLTVFSTGEVIDLGLVRLAEGSVSPPTSFGEADDRKISSYKEAKAQVIDDFTRRYVERLLEQTKGNVSEAARVSGLERVSLQKILKRVGIEADEFKKG